MIHFSNYDNIRSIPSAIDGFKPSQRKILYGSILRNIFKDEIKVAQLAGFISDKAAYHHGEASLQGAIICMAQNFVGSNNNINLLTPNGAFGDRLGGSKNAASPRYIYTQLNELTPLIFKKDDEFVYDYEDDDGSLVEPVKYAPIIPMILVNGTDGIGTGFSTQVPCFSPQDIITNIKRMQKGEEPKFMYPWYKGFTGTVIKLNNFTFQTSGVFEFIDHNNILIKELPIGVWTDNYKLFLDTLVADDKKAPADGQLLDSYKCDSGTSTVRINVTFLPGVQQKLIKTDTLYKELKLTKTVSISNMHLHDENGKMKKYATVNDIMKDYYTYRLSVYGKRKAYFIRQYENEVAFLKWKRMFLEHVITGKIIVIENKKARSKAEIISRVEELGFPKLARNIDAAIEDRSYDYITSIQLFSITPEEMEKLLAQEKEKTDQLERYRSTSLEEIWLSELEELEEAYKKWLITQSDSEGKTPKKGKGVGKAGTGAKKPLRVAI